MQDCQLALVPKSRRLKSDLARVRDLMQAYLGVSFKKEHPEVERTYTMLAELDVSLDHCLSETEDIMKLFLEMKRSIGERIPGEDDS